jgi:hypothetical protein
MVEFFTQILGEHTETFGLSLNEYLDAKQRLVQVVHQPLYGSGAMQLV